MTTPVQPLLPRLRPYQQEILQAIEQSVLLRRGLSFSVMVSRQGGKNEISAQLELDLLLAHAALGGNIVKTAPTESPQLGISRRRLLKYLRRSGLGHRLRFAGSTIEVGNASITFLSGQPDANVVGHTASLLLEVDEAQDIDPVKFERDFRPMILSTGATVVFYGTTWTSDSLLEKVRERHIALEAQDGIKRHFHFDYEAVSRDFPGYKQRALAQRELLGPRNPVWLSQYQLIPQEGAGRLFTSRELESMRGDHDEIPPHDGGTVPIREWQESVRAWSNGVPMPPEINTDRDTLTRFVAGLDIGGRFMNPERDPTVLCICRLRTPQGGQYLMPNIEIIKFISWRAPWDRIHDDLCRWEEVIGFQKLCVDSTGIGHHAAGQLSSSLGKWLIDEITFSAQTKSELCYELRDAVDSGRVKMFKGDSPHANEFWSEARKARVQLRQGSVLMGFGVPDHLGHDDYLMALALAVHAAHTTPSRFAYAYRRGDIL
jgi:hypothetical protein